MMAGARTQGAEATRLSRPDARADASPLDHGFARRPPALWISLLGAAGVHGLFALAASALVRLPRDMESRAQVASTQMFEVELEPDPVPPPPQPESEPVLARAQTVRPEPARPAPAPAAAQAAQVPVKEPEPEVVDFGETFVQGDAASYAGGTTEANSTATHAVRDAAARAGGIEGGTGADTSGLGRSRSAALASGVSWDDCPFPEEADQVGIDQARVTLRVTVSTSGAVERVEVVDDPGDGFGREARRCALKKRWQPGLDRAGNALTTTSLIKVRFTR